MAIRITVRNVPAVRRALHDKLTAIEKECQKGLISVGLVIQGDAQNLAPIDTGNLRGSAYTTWTNNQGSPPQSGAATVVEDSVQKIGYAFAQKNVDDKSKKHVFLVAVGFTASYAIFVHENLEVEHDTGEAKYLEKAVQKNKALIRETIKASAR